MRTEYKNRDELSREAMWNPRGWRLVETFDNVASFGATAREHLDGQPASRGFTYVFQEDFARENLGENLKEIEDAYRGKAKKGRAGTYLDIYDAQYRAYIVLRTDPDRQHIVWSWWKTREYRARYDIGETFR